MSPTKHSPALCIYSQQPKDTPPLGSNAGERGEAISHSPHPPLGAQPELLPPSSGCSTVPVLNHPSGVNASLVSLGLFQYSRNTEEPRTSSSPSCPSRPGVTWNRERETACMRWPGGGTLPIGSQQPLPPPPSSGAGRVIASHWDSACRLLGMGAGGRGTRHVPETVPYCSLLC